MPTKSSELNDLHDKILNEFGVHPIVEQVMLGQLIVFLRSMRGRSSEVTEVISSYNSSERIKAAYDDILIQRKSQNKKALARRVSITPYLREGRSKKLPNRRPLDYDHDDNTA